jgi:Clp amino terminal domain, pathogenicity island component
MPAWSWLARRATLDASAIAPSVRSTCFSPSALPTNRSARCYVALDLRLSLSKPISFEILSEPWEKDRSALAKLGIDLDRVLETIEANHGPEAFTATATVRPRRRFRKQRRCNDSKPNSGHIPWAPRTKKCLELSLREALRLKQNFIGPEHIALGLLREGQGLACQIITERSITLDTIKASVEACLHH